jgi:paraquat-inducible protein A
MQTELKQQTSDSLIVCHDCDMLQRRIALPPGGIATCGRCGAVLYRRNVTSQTTTLALTITALIVFIIANLFPIVTLESQGQLQSTTLMGAVVTLWNDQVRLVALLVFFTTILMPLLELVSLIMVLVLPKYSAIALRWYMAITPWAMVEVFMLGLLVSVQKLSHLASITPGVALWSFALLMILFAAINARSNVHSLWQEVSPVHASH